MQANIVTIGVCWIDIK